MALATGTVLNNIYRVVNLLGSGSMGNVYLVERIKDDRKFVIKELIFKQGVGIDENTAREIFFREAEFMVKFSHSGLPKMYGIFSQDGNDYLAMDYIEGKTLESILNSGEKIPRDRAVKWTIELADILDYLHNSFHAPIVYRDLKPSNIIINTVNSANLVDFGIARYYNPDKNTDTFSYGSPGYAAPEQYKGRGQSTPQSDVFGLGVILFQMLTGYDPTVKPFTFPPLALFDPKLEDIVKRAIELDPVKRFISIQEFKEALEKYTGKEKPSGDKIPSPGLSLLSRVMLLVGIVSVFATNICFIASGAFGEYVLTGCLYFSIFLSALLFITWAVLRMFLDKIKRRKISLFSRVMLLIIIVIIVFLNIYATVIDPGPYYNPYVHIWITAGAGFWMGLLWAYLKSWSYVIYSIRTSSFNQKIITFSSLAMIFLLLFFKFSQEAMPGIVIFSIFITPFIWSVIHFIYLIYHKILSLINSKKEPAESFLVPALIIFTVFGLLGFILVPNHLKARSSGRLAACESNLKNIATALEMYATDYSGAYPPSLDYLTRYDSYEGYSSGYMKTLPKCPSDTTASYHYEVFDNPDNFTLCCGKEKAHIATGTVSSEGCWPQYTPGEGVKLKD